MIGYLAWGTFASLGVEAQGLVDEGVWEGGVRGEEVVWERRHAEVEGVWQ